MIVKTKNLLVADKTTFAVKMKKISKNSQNSALNTAFVFAKSQNDAILCSIGRGNPMPTAGAVTVKGGELPENANADSYCFVESAGRTLCGVTVGTFSTPAGSFFVPTVESREKSLDKITNRRLELCKANLHTATVRITLPATPAITVTPPPGVCLQPSFSVPAPDLIP